MIKKLILGTANFDVKYGVKNRFRKLKKTEIKKIILCLKKKKINSIDTSQNYNNTEKMLGDLNIKNFKIITKLAFNQNKKETFKDKFFISTKNLNNNFIHTVLFHNPKDLLGKKGKEIFNELVLLKKKGFIKKIGVSVYKKEELKKILDKYKLDIVQIPLNVFNQSFISINFLRYMKRKKIEIHARSIFLQGLLLMKEKKIPKNFKEQKYLFKRWNAWLKKNNITKLEACLNFITKIKDIKKIIVGVDSLKQLKEILNFKKSKKKLNFSQLSSNSSKLTNPNKW